MYCNYEEIRSRIRELQEFTGNSAIGFWLGNKYIIQSYNTKILKINKVNCTVYFNNNYYSSTTSKIQNIIRKIIFTDLNSCKERKIYEFNYLS